MKEKFASLFNSHPVHQFPVIWGLTAQILIHLASLVYSKDAVEFEILSTDAPSWSEVTRRFIDFHLHLTQTTAAKEPE